MSVINRIERGEITVTVGINNQNVKPEDIKNAAELLRLAKIGQLYQGQLNECADEIKLCHDETCKGNMYCKAYKVEVIGR
ncbi:hypothetical protein M7775_05745 [Sporomusa sphaeroides DSM 2875]|uniref:hypothetical protein n=1 Tax=Sporomusa sphaeroides TaxID=47679 RepID=UPI00202FA3CB|nr:hypothetical protein [Sporomusa sphaeroides]MCM0758079.1 hypothetical protein [Sporomusa sphaeroides DSM 2875]